MSHSLIDSGLVPLGHRVTSLYLHIPFCRTRCHYCAFYLETGYPPRVLNETLDGMLAETRFWYEQLGHPLFDTLYIGGGTPSVVPPERLHSFFSSLTAAGVRADTLREATMEVNPESVTPELVEVLEESLIDRVSMGIQSLDNEDLAVLGRRSDRDTALRAVDYLLEHFGGRMSVDVIVGTPAQTPDRLARSLDEILSRGVAHVSLYGLTVEAGTVLAQQIKHGRLAMPSHDHHEALWDAAVERMERYGLEGYEVSNYAVPGEESLHNAAYWNLDPYIGIGPGAVGMLYARPGDSADARVVRLTGQDVFAYQKWKQGVYKPAVEVLSVTDHFFEHFMNGLRTRRGVHLGLLQQRFGCTPDTVLSVLQDHWSAFPSLQCYTDSRGDPCLRVEPATRMIIDRVLPELWSIFEAHIPALTFHPVGVQERSHEQY
ncbi:MAG: coproporphyrinogen-III oxidase family protein [bacterium]